MKKHQYALRFWFAIGALLAAVSPSWAGVIAYDMAVKGSIYEPTSWVGGVVPGANDVAYIQNTANAETVTFTFTNDVHWAGIHFDAPVSKDFSLNLYGAGVLHLGSQGFRGATSNTKNINVSVTLHLTADQTWDFQSGALNRTSGYTYFNDHTLTIEGTVKKEMKQNMIGPGTLLFRGSSWTFTDGILTDDIDVVLDMQDPNRSFTYGDLYDVDVAKSLTVLSDSNFRIYADGMWRHVTNSIPSAINLKNGLFIFSLGHGRTPKMTFYAPALEREKGMYLLRGSDLGMTPLTNTTAYGFNLALGTAPALRGAALGTGTLTPILHAAVVDSNEGGYGRGFGTYDDEFGVRALDLATEYTNAITDGQSTLDNVRIHNNGIGLVTSLVTAPLTTINSLTMTEDAGAGQCGIIVTSAPNAILKINSGMIFAYQAMTNTPTVADSLVIAVPSLDFNGQDGLIYVRETKYRSNGYCNAPFRYRSNPTNLSTNGLFFYAPTSEAYIYLENPDINTYTGPVTLGGKPYVRMDNATKDMTILGQLIVDGASCQIADHELADDTSDIILKNGSIAIQTGSSNSGNSGNENFRDLTIYGGQYQHANGGAGTVNMRNASLFGGRMIQTRGTLAYIHGDLVLAGCDLTFYTNTDSSRNGTRVVVYGDTTISNTVGTTPYIAMNMGYSYYRGPAYLSLTNKLSIIGNAVNPNAVAITRTYSTDPKTMLAEIRLNDEVECLVTDGAAEVDFDVDANFADNGTVVGKLVKTGAGTLRMTAITNALTGGIDINEGRLVLDGGASSDIAVATGATLAGDGTVDADLTFADDAVFEVEILDETTAAVLDVAGTVTASGEVTVPVAQDQADGEWLVMTADSFDAEFVSTNPRFALYTRNGGTELWLTKKLGTLILVK